MATDSKTDYTPLAITAIAVMVVFVVVVLILRSYMTRKAKDVIGNKNVQAFLQVIRYAEGTSGTNGYRTMFTGKLFDNGFAGHPNIRNCAGSLCSTAAGAYQFLYSTWVYLSVRLQLSDFSPANQDLAAIELIREKGALEDVIAGRFEAALQKCNKTWASLPGSPYGQPVKTVAELKGKYLSNGGVLTA